MRAILGKKLGMTRVFTENGQCIPVTLLEAGPCTVTQRKTFESDCYSAVQIGFGAKKEQRCTSPELGHFKKAGVVPCRVLREIPVEDESALKVGDVIKADIFAQGDRVDVTGTSKGKGFQGVIKRHGFGGGPGAHGSHFHRAPGSIGTSADPSRVFKGRGLPGHMGGQRVTTQNLEVVSVDPEKNLIAVRGAIPGAPGGIVLLKASVKGKK